MPFNKITPVIISALEQLIGKPYVLSDKENLEKYAADETEDLKYFPEVIVKPRTPEEVASIMKLCNKELIPVTPRGAGTGLSGGALPVNAGVVIAMERFNQLLQIDERNLQATVEPGVINQVFQEAVAEKGLFYP